MALYPGPNIATFTTLFTDTDTGRIWSSATYWEKASTQITASNADAAATAYHTQFCTAAADLFHSSVSISRTLVRVYATGELIEGVGGTATSGTTTSGYVLPRTDCVVIQRKTGRFGRSNAGRIFLSGIAANIVKDGVLVDDGPTYAKSIATFLSADRTFSVAFHARHWNRKDNTFYPIKHCYAVLALATRKDRAGYRSNAVAA